MNKKNRRQMPKPSESESNPERYDDRLKTYCKRNRELVQKMRGAYEERVGANAPPFEVLVFFQPTLTSHEYDAPMRAMCAEIAYEIGATTVALAPGWNIDREIAQAAARERATQLKDDLEDLGIPAQEMTAATSFRVKCDEDEIDDDLEALAGLLGPDADHVVVYMSGGTPGVAHTASLGVLDLVQQAREQDVWTPVSIVSPPAVVAGTSTLTLEDPVSFGFKATVHGVNNVVHGVREKKTETGFRAWLPELPVKQKQLAGKYNPRDGAFEFETAPFSPSRIRETALSNINSHVHDLHKTLAAPDNAARVAAKARIGKNGPGVVKAMDIKEM